ncbi:MAG: RsmB/NOP family class I SAM-dependent RNA methyltransferase [candidate division WOR-3 bacterium]
MADTSRRTLPPEFVERYKQFIPDFEAFSDAMLRPPRRTLRVNTLKASREEVLEWIGDLAPNQSPWWDLAFEVREADGLGKRLGHFIGLYYLQDASSMVPPLVLDPNPGELVLDMAAAPGSKTTQMAAMMQNTGLLIANDSSSQRIRGLLGNIDRAGCLNVAVCRMDGVLLSRRLAGKCDRVLVDAPCTCEGTIRRSGQALDRWSVEACERFGRLQKGLAVAGYRSLKPGGVMVYSTCTIAPEENEEVVVHVLDKFPDAEVLPVELPGFAMRPALEKWRGRTFPGALRNCRRILPQDNDSEAFFVALIRKGRTTDETGFREGIANQSSIPQRRTQEPRSRSPSALSATTPRPVRELCERFGVPAVVFQRLGTATGPGAVFVGTHEVMAFNAVRPMRRGIRLLRVFPHSVKPTTWAMQILGRYATRNCIDVTESQAVRLIGGEQLETVAPAEDGFVLIRCREFVVGVGLYRRPFLKSLIPRHRPVQDIP